MIDFLRRAHNKDVAGRRRRISRVKDSVAPSLGATVETGDLCETIEIALATCDYEYVVANVDNVVNCPVLEVMPCVERLSVECLEEVCPQNVQMRILTLLECLMSEVAPSSDFMPMFVRKCMCVLADGTRFGVIPCIVRCFTTLLSQERGLIDYCDMSLIVPQLEICQDDVVQFIKVVVGSPITVELLRELTGLLMSGAMSAGRIIACSWILVFDVRAIEYLDLDKFIREALMCPVMNDYLKVLLLSVAYEHIPEYDISFVCNVFPMLHSGNQDLAAAGFFTIRCFLDSHVDGAHVLLDLGFLDHVASDQSFLVKREWTRCFCKILESVPAPVRCEIVNENMIADMVSLIGEVNKELSTEIIEVLVLLTFDNRVLAWLQDIPIQERCEDREVNMALRQLLDIVRV